MSENIELFGAFELPSPLAVSQGCLGKRLPVRIGNREGRLWLPRLIWQDDRPELVAPSMEPSVQQRLGNRYWGKVSSWNSNRIIGEAYVAALWFAFLVPAMEVQYFQSRDGRGQPHGAPLKDLFHGVESWFEHLRTWTEVLVDQDLLADRQLPSGWTVGHGLVLITHDAVGASPTAHPNEGHVVSRPAEVLTLPKLRRVVRGANEGLPPSEAQLLIRDARGELRRGRTRRSVIDAGTAVELTLANFNASVTKVRPKKGGFLMLGGYVKNTKIARAGGLPPTTNKKLVQPRNKAVHENRIPSRPDAAAAVDIARAIVHRLDPPAV